MAVRGEELHLYALSQHPGQQCLDQLFLVDVERGLEVAEGEAFYVDEDLMEGFRTYYNFIRPHMSLDGQTSAEASGLNLELGENKWLSLIKKASSST